MPEGLSDRAEDVLEPLFAIADLAGGGWRERTRRAALALMGTAARVAQEQEQNIGLELLADIRGIFEEQGNPDVLKTHTIIEALKGIEDRPWATFTKGDKPITPHRLRLMLKTFDVVAGGQMWVEGRKTRGYRLAAFVDAFDRYLPRDLDSKAVERDEPNKYGAEVAETQAVGAETPTALKMAVSPNKHGVPTALPLLTPDHGHGGARDDGDDDDDQCYFGA